MNEVVIRAEALHKRYTEGGLDVPVLKGIDLELRQGETPRCKSCRGAVR